MAKRNIKLIPRIQNFPAPINLPYFDY